jgi:hypothetical protein
MPSMAFTCARGSFMAMAGSTFPGGGVNGLP